MKQGAVAMRLLPTPPSGGLHTYGCLAVTQEAEERPLGAERRVVAYDFEVLKCLAVNVHAGPMS